MKSAVLVVLVAGVAAANPVLRTMCHCTGILGLNCTGVMVSNSTKLLKANSLENRTRSSKPVAYARTTGLFPTLSASPSPAESQSGSAAVATLEEVGTSASSTPSSNPVGGQNSGEMTFYNITAGTTSCGDTYTESASVAALHPSQMPNDGNPNNSPSCGRTINLYSSGIGPIPVTVVDTCGGCAGIGDVDVSESVFTKFASESAGRIPVTWSWA
jgi:hypothetical protein